MLSTIGKRGTNSMRNRTNRINRRTFLKTSAVGVAAFGTGIQLILPEDAHAAAKVIVKYDWLMSNGQIGDIP